MRGQYLQKKVAKEARERSYFGEYLKKKLGVI